MSRTKTGQAARLIQVIDRSAVVEELARIAKGLRADVIRMTTEAGSGHPGGSLSAADIVATLYFYIMKHDPKKPKWADRDVFILSKGHAAPILYAALARAGYFNRSVLWTLRKINSDLQGHPDMRKTPGVEISTGSLGHGIAAANGFAIARKLDKTNSTVYVMIGDGESQEGEVWEAAMFAAHYNLDNIVAVMDYNGLQIDGAVSDVMSIEPITDKWKAFGWNVLEIDGHDISQIIEALESARSFAGRPSMIIARTVKGKGVSFIENVADFHGKALSREQMEKALKELE